MRVLDLTMSLRRTKKLDISVLKLLKDGLKSKNKKLEDLNNEDEFVALILDEADKAVDGKLPRFNGTQRRIQMKEALESKRLAIKDASKTIIGNKVVAGKPSK